MLAPKCEEINKHAWTGIWTQVIWFLTYLAVWQEQKSSMYFFSEFHWLVACIQSFRIHGSLASACPAAPAPGNFSPFQQVERNPQGREMLSEAGDLQLEFGVQSQATLLHNSSSVSQAHMGFNSTATGHDLPANLHLLCRQLRKGGLQLTRRRKESWTKRAWGKSQHWGTSPRGVQLVNYATWRLPKPSQF